jgi:hypothetical protein
VKRFDVETRSANKKKWKQKKGYTSGGKMGWQMKKVEFLKKRWECEESKCFSRNSGRV